VPFTLPLEVLKLSFGQIASKWSLWLVKYTIIIAIIYIFTWTIYAMYFLQFAGMFAIVIEGIIRKGGVSEVFQIANEHGRIQFLK